MKLIIVGIAQDGGIPQPLCSKKCCQEGCEKKLICSLAVKDEEKYYFFDCSPDFREQISFLNKQYKMENIDGIFLTHAHMGHYTGLIHLGRESMNSKSLNVFGSKEMNNFLSKNAPWCQLVDLKNIKLNTVLSYQSLKMSNDLLIIPFTVPHRAEFTDTLGFIIQGKNKKAVYIPDIDSWEEMNENIEDVIERVDFAFLDGTFYDENEVLNRDITKIPHPFIKNSVKRFSNFIQKSKIYFIHLNHTNPCVKKNSEERILVESLGFNFGNEFDEFDL
eukprot:gene8923-872_t